MKTRNIGRKTDSKTNFAPVCMGRKLNAAFNVNNRGEFSCEQDLDSFQMSESSVTSCELCLYYQVPEWRAAGLLMIIKTFHKNVIILKEKLKHANIKFCYKFKALTRKLCVVQILPDKLVSGVK